MSQENVETLRGGFDAFARGDVDDVLERLDPDAIVAGAYFIGRGLAKSGSSDPYTPDVDGRNGH